MKNYLFHVGIDISKLKLDVCILDVSLNQSDYLIVENSSNGLKELIKYLKKRKLDLSSILFCCENTGVYTYPLSVYFSENDMDYWVVPALEIKRSKGISRGKNDKSDSKDIAFYSYRNLDKLVLTRIAEKEIQELKLLYTEREKIINCLKMLESTSENKQFISKSIYKSVELINQRTIKDLQKSLSAIEIKTKKIITEAPKLKQQFELVKSIPGIGEQTAIYLIIATKGFKAFKTWRKFACYAGVAPFEYRSGSSIKGRTKVNHIADKKMK